MSVSHRRWAALRPRPTLRAIVRSAGICSLLLGAEAAPPLASQETESGAPGRFRIGDTPEARAVPPSLLGALRYRMIGPYRGGRVTAVAGHPAHPHSFFMGAVGGGIWRTDDAGETWKNVSDGHLRVGPIGALAIAPSDPNVVYAGTGSGGVRGNVSVGDGVYRSTDGGKSWHYLGLPHSEHVNRIQVHPRDPDLVYVAALGHIFGPHEERGVYRSRDGGGSWERVLHVSPRTGAIDLVMDPSNPRVLYAAMWQAERKPWAMRGGGEEGGVWKTTDGGGTWEKLENGLPGIVGRIGLAVSPARPSRVYALVEAEGDLRGLYRSDDAGASFVHVSNDRNLTARPWYYMHVDAHPTDENTVFVSNEGFYRSLDAGKDWEEIDTPHGDNHDLWINPESPDIWIQSNDGGANVTLDGGETWSTLLNQPTAEFYSVTVDGRFPYRVYGPQQDNTTIGLPSRVTGGLTHSENWFEVAGCETGPIAVHPVEPEITYGGCQGQITIHDRRTGQERAIWEFPQEYHGRANAELVYRHQWNSAIEISPHDPEVVYHTSQYVHRTTDRGQSWEAISPDLTNWEEHRELQTAPPGGPLTYDQTGVEIYGTVFALEESPHRRGVLWAGSDDGRVHITRDGGESWTDITPPGMELHTTVNRIEPSPHAPGRAYIAAHRYRLDDWRPLVWRTDDYGASWSLLTDGTNGIPADHPTRVVREDPDRRGLLYAGTEFGLFVSFDDGRRWQPLQLNLPATPVTDLVVTGKDLVVATQGRGLWILDDLTPLHQLTDSLVAALGNADGGPGGADRPRARAGEPRPGGPVGHLFRPRSAHRLRLGASFLADQTRQPENPPEGATVDYSLSSGTREAAGDPIEVVLEIADAGGRPVKRLSSDSARVAAGDAHGRLEPRAGLNRAVWDLRWPGAYIAPGVHVARSGDTKRVQPITGYTGGPWAAPGSYTVTLSIGGRGVGSWPLEVLPDPRLETTREEYEELLDLSLRVRDRISEVQRAVARLNEVLERLDSVAARTEDPEVRTRVEEVRSGIVEVARELYKHRQEGDHAHLHPELTTSYARIASMLIQSDHRPPDSAHERFGELEPELRERLGRLREIYRTEVSALNRMLEEKGVPPVVVPGGESGRPE